MLTTIIIPINKHQDYFDIYQFLDQSEWNNHYPEILIVINESAQAEANFKAINEKFRINILYNEKVKSPYISRNIALQSMDSRSEMVILMDVNKLPVEKNWLPLLLKEFNEKQTDLLICQSINIKPNEEYTKLELFDILNYKTPELKDLIRKEPFPISLWMMKKTIFIEIGLFPPNRSLSDIVWTKRFFKENKKASISDGVWISYKPRRGKFVFLKAMRMGYGKRQQLNMKPRKLICFLFKQLLPPNPRNLYKRIKEREEWPSMSNHLFVFYFYAYAYKLSYFAGAFLSSPPKE